MLAEHASRNVELKARDPDPARTLQRCREIGAVEAGSLFQRDTYFNVPRGRLKLREQEPAAAMLVQYLRPDEARARVSAYVLIEVPEPEKLKQALTDSLGIACVVEKQRRLFLWEETVRIHLDQVAGLGDFVEIEAVAPAGSNLAREQAQSERLRRLLEIEDDGLVASSYADLVQ